MVAGSQVVDTQHHSGRAPGILREPGAHLYLGRLRKSQVLGGGVSPFRGPRRSRKAPPVALEALFAGVNSLVLLRCHGL